jgi:hypothetical protein
MLRFYVEKDALPANTARPTKELSRENPLSFSQTFAQY